MPATALALGAVRWLGWFARLSPSSYMLMIFSYSGFSSYMREVGKTIYTVNLTTKRRKREVQRKTSPAIIAERHDVGSRSISATTIRS